MLAFVWNTSTIKTRQGVFFTKNRTSALYKAFLLDEFYFELMIFHLHPLHHKAHSTDIQRLHQVLDKVKEKGEEKNCCSILVGDFNEYSVMMS